jgi:DNA polymerase V
MPKTSLIPVQLLESSALLPFTSPSPTLLKLPVFFSTVSAGFPSPAEDTIELGIDLNKLLIQHPAATFLVRVSGTSMIDVGIFPDDLLVVDRSLQPYPNAIVVGYYNDEFLVKRLVKKPEGLYLIAENKKFPFTPVKVTEDVVIWGVVKSVVRMLG